MGSCVWVRVSAVARGSDEGTNLRPSPWFIQPPKLARAGPLASRVKLLDDLSARYARTVLANSDSAVLVEVGRVLFACLDGDHSQVGNLLERARAPLVFEIREPRTVCPAARQTFDAAAACPIDATHRMTKMTPKT